MSSMTITIPREGYAVPTVVASATAAVRPSIRTITDLAQYFRTLADPVLQQPSDESEKRLYKHFASALLTFNTPKRDVVTWSFLSFGSISTILLEACRYMNVNTPRGWSGLPFGQFAMLPA